MRKYVIKWRSKITGVMGQGTDRFTLSEVVKIARHVDKEYPELSHWAQRVCK